VSVDLGYSAGTSPRQYVTEQGGGPAETFDRRYIFGVVRRRETYARLRLDYSLSPEVTLETYVEPFASAGQYLRFGELTRPRTHDLRIYGTDGTTITASAGRYEVRDANGAFSFADPDFNLRSFRSNVVLRWEWRRGSAFYAVWQQDLADRVPNSDTLGPGALWDSLRGDGTHRVLVKLTYWLAR
jgi:hypothetical protein